MSDLVHAGLLLAVVTVLGSALLAVMLERQRLDGHSAHPSRLALALFGGALYLSLLLVIAGAGA